MRWHAECVQLSSEASELNGLLILFAIDAKKKFPTLCQCQLLKAVTQFHTLQVTMLFYAQIADWMFSMSLTLFFVSILALYYVFLKGSDRGRD
jgi:hypothetical protein